MRYHLPSDCALIKWLNVVVYNHIIWLKLVVYNQLNAIQNVFWWGVEVAFKD